MLDAGKESPYQGWLEQWEENGFRDPEITARVDVGEYVEVRTKALLAHATQIDPDSWWFAIPDDVIKKVYPWEDYTLITSTVETKTPEDDLFPGIDVALHHSHRLKPGRDVAAARPLASLPRPLRRPCRRREPLR